MKRLIAFTLLVCFTSTFVVQDKAFASHFGGPSNAAGSAGAPAGRILESFHSDLATGRAVFGIPLAVSPGRRGIQPNLSLNYSSSAKNGPIGVGWNLELGLIERSTRFGLPKFDSTDTFVLRYGGVMADLVQVAPGEYHLKDEQLFAKILFTTTRWTLTTKDGTVATFGAGPNSQLVVPDGTVAWYLNEMKDIHGNVMTIGYTHFLANGPVYPTSIQYTAHPASGLLPIQEVRFIWESRSDVEWDHRFGSGITADQRLRLVEAWSAGALVRRYTLAYAQSPVTGRSLLTTVTTTGSDGITSLPPITLRASDTWGGWFRSDQWKTLGGSILDFVDSQGKDIGARLEDVTGDGMADLLQWKAGGSPECWRGTGSGWVQDNRFAPPKAFLWNGQDAGARFADLNGDGRTDLYYGRSDAGPREAYLNTGSGWTLSTAWSGVTASEELLFTGNQGQDTGMRFIDLNGDGKTDLLQATNTIRRAWINTGSGWVEDNRWTPPSAFLDVNGGMDRGCRFADMNGDGLTDLFYASASAQAVYLNTGRGWKSDSAWNSGPFLNEVVVGPNGEDYGWRLLDVNGDGLADLAHAKEGMAFQVLVNTGTRWVIDNGFAPSEPFVSAVFQDLGVRFAEMNGDGLIDLVYGNPSRLEYTRLWTSSAGTVPATPPDLLVQVQNGVGGTTTLNYQPSTLYDNTGGDGIEDLPFIIQTVASQTIRNGMGWSATTRLTYQGGKFEAAEREFLGFSYAKVTDPIGAFAQSWFHQSVHLKGRPYKQEARDAAGNLYTRTENSWACTDLTGGAHFCHLASSTSTVFDGDATFKETRASYTYDNYGNVIQQVEEGDTAVLGDERTTTTDYTFNPTLWLMGFPAHAVTVDALNTKLGEAWFTYDGNTLPTDPPTKGLLTKSESRLSTGPPNPVATSTYDAFGNRLTVTDPLGRTTTTAYDSQGIFPIQVRNAVGHTLKTTYDLGTGNILSTTDPNNQTTRNSYDPLGRLVNVIGPLDTDAAPGVRYEYNLSSFPTRVTKQVKFSPSAGFFTSNYYTTYSFADGLGRAIQVRSPAKDPTKQIVSGSAELGPRGEVVAQSLPHFESTSGNYSSPDTTAPRVRYEYDAMGRLTKIIDPDGAVSTTIYSDWTVTGIDAKGNATTKESDAYGRLSKVTEPATADHSAGTTIYSYDPAGRLIRVTDAKGNVTRMAYDSLGRKLSMTDPDMGTWRYAYDLVGNLTQQTDAKGQILQFTYDALNRLTQKQSPVSATPGSFPSSISLATYIYDDAAKPNGVGRLSKVTDQSGSTEFFYDLLGREVKTAKTIGLSSFTVSREYDPLNRLTRLVYPDGTDCRYEYSPQGIQRIYSVNADGSTVDYLASAESNAAGEMLKLELGNGVTTDYTYDPLTLRIASIRTADSIGRTLQDLSYTFDEVGNLTSLTDRWNTATQSFQYDALNRLTGASGAYGSYPYRYDSLGNLLQKDNSPLLTYGLADGTKPHAVTEARTARSGTIALSYDANGNLLQKGSDQFSYNLENRLTRVVHGLGVSGSVTYSLSPGWNLVGIPWEEVQGQAIPSALKSLTQGTDYDQISTPKSGGTPPWVSYVGDARFDEFSTLESCGVYEIYVTNPLGVSFTLTGKTPGRRVIKNLGAGWNLIPSPVLADTPVDQALVGLKAGTDYDEVIRYNPLTKTWSAVTTVKPGEAYWIHLLAAKSWTVPTPLTQKTTNFTYDGDGGRVKVTVDGSSDLSVGELYEKLSSGTTKSHIFFGPTRLCTLERTTVLVAQGTVPEWGLSPPSRFRRAYASAKRFSDSVEEFFVGRAYAAAAALPPGTSLYFYHSDHLGSVNLVTDSTGKQVELAEHTPFGGLSRLESSSSGSSSSSSGSTGGSNSFHFTGKRLDSSTGLYYYGARYYDPELGRFTQPDTIVQAPSDPQTLNRYTYARNNPLIYTDPTGHKFWRRVLRAFVAIVAAAVVTVFAGPQAGALTYAAINAGYAAYDANRAGASSGQTALAATGAGFSGYSSFQQSARTPPFVPPGSRPVPTFPTMDSNRPSFLEHVVQVGTQIGIQHAMGQRVDYDRTGRDFAQALLTGGGWGGNYPSGYGNSFVGPAAPAIAVALPGLGPLALGFLVAATAIMTVQLVVSYAQRIRFPERLPINVPGPQTGEPIKRGEIRPPPPDLPPWLKWGAIGGLAAQGARLANEGYKMFQEHIQIPKERETVIEDAGPILTGNE